MEAKQSTPNPLKVVNFRLLFTGESISVLGDQFAMIALPWLVLQLTGSSVALGAVLALMSIPRALFMVIGGAFVDRLTPRKVMIASNLTRMLLVGFLTILIFTNLIQVWMLFIFAFLFGSSDAFYFPAQNSLVPQILEKEQLQTGNSIIQGTAQLSTLIGPALAGIVIGMFSQHSSNSMNGIAVALLIDTLSFLATIIACHLIKVNKSPGNDDNKHILAAIKEGARYVWQDKLLRMLLVVVTLINFFIVGPFEVGIPVLAQKKFPEGAAAYGIIVGSFGAGAVIGILLSGLLPRLKGKYLGPIIMILIAFQGIMLTLIPLGKTTTVVALISLIMGSSNGYVNIVAFTWLQKRIPEKLMGRVMSLVMFASFGLIPISSFISGLILNINLTALFIAGGLATVIFAVFTSLLPVTKQMGSNPDSV